MERAIQRALWLVFGQVQKHQCAGCSLPEIKFHVITSIIASTQTKSYALNNCWVLDVSRPHPPKYSEIVLGGTATH